jgi:molybdopterin/thiamine biosynthesis adenylyltransferase
VIPGLCRKVFKQNGLILLKMFNMFRKKKRVAIVGLGGLGSATALTLVREGITDLLLIDDDIVELSNLDRQSLYTEEDIGHKKVKCAAKALHSIDPSANIVIRKQMLDEKSVGLLDEKIVLDCTDNLKARYLINSYCVKNRIPWVFCTVSGDHGLVRFMAPEGPCLKCFYKKPSDPETSRSIGILNSAVQLASSIQSTLALKHLSGESVPDELISFSAWHSKLTKIKVNKTCERCG